MHAHAHARVGLPLQVSKDLCKLSSELPFDFDECDLATEESASGGVDLKRFVKVRASRVCGACVARAWRVRGACMARAHCAHCAHVCTVCMWHLSGGISLGRRVGSVAAVVVCAREDTTSTRLELTSLCAPHPSVCSQMVTKRVTSKRE